MDGDFVLVLLSFGLVLVATVLLVLGVLIDGGLELIYASIITSFVAAVLLGVAVKVSKPKEQQAAEAPSPLPDKADKADKADKVPAAAARAGAMSSAERDEPTTVAPVVTPVPPPPPVPTASGDESWRARDQEWAEPASGADDAGVEFPIADYDDLKVSEILPLLPQLYTDELDVVEERERSTKARSTVLNALGDLRTEAAELDSGAVVPAAAEEPPDRDTGADDVLPFPIEDYDDLTAAEITSVLDQLAEDELLEVREREVRDSNRVTLVRAIDRALGDAAPAPRATAKSTPAKRSAAKKKAPAKRSAGAAKSTAKRAGSTRKTPAAKKRAPAKKKAPAKRGGARKR
ncbi:hypothetical protein BH20ACT2_BH20ACT2_24680 [soil metagenome]